MIAHENVGLRRTATMMANNNRLSTADNFSDDSDNNDLEFDEHLET